MNRGIKLSGWAALAGVLMATSAGAQPPWAGGGRGGEKNKEEERRGGGQGPGGRPTVMPSGPLGGAPFGGQSGGPSKMERRRQDSGGEQSAPPSFSRGPSKRNEEFSRSVPSFEPPTQPSRSSKSSASRPSAPSGFSGGQVPPFGVSQQMEERGGGSSKRAGKSRNIPSAPELTGPGSSEKSRPGGGPSGVPGPSGLSRGSSKSGGPSPFGTGGAPLERGRKNVPSLQGGNMPPSAPPTGTAQGGGKSRNAPGLRQGGLELPQGLTGAPGTGVSGKSAEPGGGPRNLPPGLAGSSSAPGLSKKGIPGADGAGGAFPGNADPKGVARGITGNLPPGLSRKLGSGGLPSPAAAGLSGKSASLPPEISSSAVRAFKGMKGMPPGGPGGAPRFDDPQKAVSIGMNLALAGGAVSLGYSKLLGRDDALTFFGAGAPPPPAPPLTHETVLAIKSGLFPPGVAPPPLGFGYVRPPALPPAVYTAPGYLPPPVTVGLGAAPAFSWNYWDGRCRYDHDYARSLFVSIGHTPWNGYDGVLVRGRYYAFGYGWVDGCINYGSGRVWVPGFWSSQAVEECNPVPVWMPPVYEDVWTGCCWETVQVAGGYFAPAPVEECHQVVRHVWVPGHYEYYYT